MPNLKDIRRRIQSVKSTQKITQAMKMVAAAKVKRAENRVKAARPYAKALTEVFAATCSSLDANALSEAFVYAGMFTPRVVKRVAILAISADRGLCGAYHASMLRQFWKLSEQYTAQGIEAHFYVVGNKLAQAYKRHMASGRYLGQKVNITVAPTVQDAADIASVLLQAYQSGQVDRIELLSAEFISMIANQVRHQVLFPVVPETTKTTAAATLLIEPNAEVVLNQLVPMFVRNRVYQALLEASASEQASRMTAMSNATKNAGEMITRLTIQYNKARQASITQEILEIVSGAQSL
jgi:F-type H+-transporting ATPase subunit gamma